MEHRVQKSDVTTSRDVRVLHFLLDLLPLAHETVHAFLLHGDPSSTQLLHKHNTACKHDCTIRKKSTVVAGNRVTSEPCPSSFSCAPDLDRLLLPDQEPPPRSLLPPHSQPARSTLASAQARSRCALPTVTSCLGCVRLLQVRWSRCRERLMEDWDCLARVRVAVPRRASRESLPNRNCPSGSGVGVAHRKTTSATSTNCESATDACGDVDDAFASDGGVWSASAIPRRRCCVGKRVARRVKTRTRRPTSVRLVAVTQRPSWHLMHYSMTSSSLPVGETLTLTRYWWQQQCLFVWSKRKTQGEAVAGPACRLDLRDWDSERQTRI